MKSDLEIQHDIAQELTLDPRVTNENISASVKDGIVTLRGKVPHFFEKSIVESVVWRINGVRAIADEIQVKLPGSYEKSDYDIARAALQAIESRFAATESLRLTVDSGWITLGGQINWEIETAMAKNIVSAISGVLGVTNNLSAKLKERRRTVRTGNHIAHTGVFPNRLP